jgi:hypothetical protein
MKKEHHRFLGNEAENQQSFVAFVASSSGHIWQKYKNTKHTLFYLPNFTTLWKGKCNKTLIFWASLPFNPSRSLYLYLWLGQFDI